MHLALPTGRRWISYLPALPALPALPMGPPAAWVEQLGTYAPLRYATATQAEGPCAGRAKKTGQAAGRGR